MVLTRIRQMIRGRGRLDGGGKQQKRYGKNWEAVDSFEGVLDLGLVKAVYVCSGLPYWEEGNPQEEDARSRVGNGTQHETKANLYMSRRRYVCSATLVVGPISDKATTDRHHFRLGHTWPLLKPKSHHRGRRVAEAIASMSRSMDHLGHLHEAAKTVSCTEPNHVAARQRCKAC
jgi:hypothetical protein